MRFCCFFNIHLQNTHAEPLAVAADMFAALSALFVGKTVVIGEPINWLLTRRVWLAELAMLSATFAVRLAVVSVRSAVVVGHSAVLSVPSAVHSALLVKEKVVRLSAAKTTVGFAELAAPTTDGTLAQFVLSG